MKSALPDDLLARYRRGDEQAAQEVFRRYTDRLIALARSRLGDRLARRIDAEDVVQSVYRSFFADVRNGRYEVQRGGDLWQLLVTITLHKLNDQVKHSSAQKRAAGRQRHFGSEDSLLNLQLLMAREPSPVEAVVLTEQVEQLMRGLEPLHQQVLELRLQGYRLEEIAAQIGYSQRTVIRVLDRIKKQLVQEQREDRHS